MENLIKPADYAKKMGISRQAVYAKIKKGLLPSRNVGGKIYIVLEDAERPAAPVQGASEGGSENVRELLAAKEETIAVLKETIRDLKETNRMITSTLRSEVELLKEAFGEMKTLYAARLERLEPETITLAEFAEEEAVPVEADTGATQCGEGSEAREEWIELEQFFQEQTIEKKGWRKRFVRRVKRLYDKGSPSVRKEGKHYFLTPRKAAGVLQKVLKEKGR